MRKFRGSLKRRLKKTKRLNPAAFMLAAVLIGLVLAAVITKQQVIKIPFFPNTGLVNGALGRVVTTSSAANSNFAGAKAVDGDQATYWESSGPLPATITVALDHPTMVSLVNVKMPAAWGTRTETIEVLGSQDNVTFTRIVAPTSYAIRSTSSISFNPIKEKYIRLVISVNKNANSAQLSELEVYGANPPGPWEIQSVDVMKYSKDVVCNPPTDAFIAAQVASAKDLGANFVAISTPYDELPCGSSLTLTTRWVNAIRAQGLHVWHRHMKNSFEGINGVPKKYKDDPLQIMSEYIIKNPTLFAQGDIFTPTPEPDSAGISGVTTCYGVCQFKDIADFNQWIRNAQLIAKLSFAKIGLPDMIIGYYGTSGFIVFGENNPDWTGKSLLEKSTVDAMGGIIAMDIYPEFYGGNMAANLDAAHAVWPNATFVIGEWGTISIATDSAKVQAVNSTMGAAQRPYVKGFNYWTLGPAGNEGLLNASGSALPAYQAVKEYYSGFH